MCYSVGVMGCKWIEEQEDGEYLVMFCDGSSIVIKGVIAAF
jgi:hypothetical protein